MAALASGTVHELRDPQVHGFGDAVWALGMLVIAWLVGWAVRARQQRIGVLEVAAVEAEARHAEQVAAATFAERAAIARELHDIVAHAVSVIVIQAQAGARALPANTALATRILEQIETTGRAALSELRGLLTLLADTASAPAAVQPAASLAQLDELIERCRASGLHVEVDIDMPLPRLSPMAELATYRVVQEALTNTLRHSPGAAAQLQLRQRGGLLEIHVEDDGAHRDPAEGTGGGSGRGLIGMRERLALAGGQLAHAAATPTGFCVHAVVPIDDSTVTRVQEPIG
jgi:signal transduction histidine kinase